MNEERTWLAFCRSLFVLLSVFFWPLYRLSLDLWLLITPLYRLSLDLWLLITPLYRLSLDTHTKRTLMCYGRVSSSCSTSGNHCIANPILSDEWGEDMVVIMSSNTYILSSPHSSMYKWPQIYVLLVVITTLSSPHSSMYKWPQIYVLLVVITTMSSPHSSMYKW
jgi:hypothetical protein